MQNKSNRFLSQRNRLDNSNNYDDVKHLESVITSQYSKYQHNVNSGMTTAMETSQQKKSFKKSGLYSDAVGSPAAGTLAGQAELTIINKDLTK